MAEQRVQRRLAAILAADVVGYSRLMGEDEEGTLAALTAHLTELIEPCIAEHRGRVVKTTGDGMLAEFASVVDAVRCAVAFQDGMKDRNAETPEAKRVVFRIGINLGDVIVQDDDVYGDGVNVAARLEGLAEPGGVIVSGKVREEVHAKLDFGFEDLGPQVVKNISDPVSAFQISATAKPKPRSDNVDSPPPLPDKPSIAVLPFENISGDPEQEYFTDGMTEDLITDLSKISGLFVIARNSSFAYKGKQTDVRIMGRELGVRHVLEGSVRRAGDRVRINAQLIDTVSGGHLWAERYDGNISDIFDLQDEIGDKIVSALQVELSEKELGEKKSTYTPNWEAYDHFIRGRQIAHEGYFARSSRSNERLTQSSLAPARELFQRTIELDPGFAGGYAGLSWVYSLGVRQRLSDSPDQDKEEAHRLAERAVEIDNAFGWSHTALASARLMLGRHEEAVDSAKAAVRAQPSDADAQGYLGLCLIWSCRPEEALPYLESALRLDPRFHARTISWLGYAYFGMRRYEDAVTALEQGTGPTGIIIHFNLVYLAASYSQSGRAKDASATIEKLLERYPSFDIGALKKLLLYRDEADTELFCAAVRAAGLPE